MNMNPPKMKIKEDPQNNDIMKYKFEKMSIQNFINNLIDYNDKHK